MNRSFTSLFIVTGAVLATACSTPEHAGPASSSVASSLGTATIHGKIAATLLNPRGEVDGAILKDGTIVRLPPGSLAPDALGADDEVDVTGDVGTIGGNRTVERASVTRNGQVLTAAAAPPPPPPPGEGPREAEARLPTISAKAEVRAVLRNREGMADGLALGDGTTARVPPTAGLDALGVKVGDLVTVRGRGTATAKGKGIRAESLTLASGKTVVVDTPPGQEPAPPPPGAAPPPPL